MRECIDEAELEFFTPSRADKYFFAKNFIGYIEKLKSQRVTKEEYLANIETNPTLLPRIKELEAENKDLLLNKARLEATLEDTLLDGKTKKK